MRRGFTKAMGVLSLSRCLLGGGVWLFSSSGPLLAADAFKACPPTSMPTSSRSIDLERSQIYSMASAPIAFTAPPPKWLSYSIDENQVLARFKNINPNDPDRVQKMIDQLPKDEVDIIKTNAQNSIDFIKSQIGKNSGTSEYAYEPLSHEALDELLKSRLQPDDPNEIPLRYSSAYKDFTGEKGKDARGNYLEPNADRPKSLILFKANASAGTIYHEYMRHLYYLARKQNPSYRAPIAGSAQEKLEKLSESIEIHGIKVGVHNQNAMHLPLWERDQSLAAYRYYLNQAQTEIASLPEGSEKKSYLEKYKASMEWYEKAHAALQKESAELTKTAMMAKETKLPLQ